MRSASKTERAIPQSTASMPNPQDRNGGQVHAVSQIRKVHRTRRVSGKNLRARGQSIGRPKALDASKAALVQRMHASGESATTIAATLGVSRATIYRVLADTDSAD